jgi:glutamyl-tRNA reductase
VSIVVVGLNHKTAPVSLLERLAITDDTLIKALHQLGTYEHLLEGVILSTCNRVEVYASVTKFHGGAQDLRNFLSEACHVAPEEFSDHLYTYHDDSAVRHLFRVAAGIDSMVVGESEILGQVRRAWQAAADEDTSQRALGDVFRRALRVGKRARSETAIGRNPVSVSSAAVELARRAFGDGTLADKRVVVVGAGKMGRLAAQALATAGATDVVVVNRSEERGKEVAEVLGASFKPLESLGRVLADADIVICSTTAPGTVIDRSTVEGAVGRRDRPLFIVDIAVPRDVEPGVRAIDGVVVRDIDDLRGVVESSLGSRLGELTKVEEIIAGELALFVDRERAADAAPTVAALVASAETIRAAEVERLVEKLGALAPAERDALEAATKRIVAKLLHEPVNKAKELARARSNPLYLEAVRELFELDDDLPT